MQCKTSVQTESCQEMHARKTHTKYHSKSGLLGLMPNEETSGEGEVIWRWWLWSFIISNYFLFIVSISNNILSEITCPLIINSNFSSRGDAYAT